MVSSCVCYVINQSTVSASNNDATEILYMFDFNGQDSRFLKTRQNFMYLAQPVSVKNCVEESEHPRPFGTKAQRLTSNTEHEMVTSGVSILCHLNRYHPLLCKKQRHFCVFFFQACHHVSIKSSCWWWNSYQGCYLQPHMIRYLITVLFSTVPPNGCQS